MEERKSCTLSCLKVDDGSIDNYERNIFDKEID